MRKMAELVVIDDIEVHPNADSLEICVIDGWRCISRKGEFRVGEVAVFVQPDAWVPNELAPFLSKGKDPRAYNGIVGEKLKTVRLRGEVSQGLLLKTEIFKNLSIDIPFAQFPSIGDDVSELLKIQKWEAPLPSELQGTAKGNFPSWARKTDQDRIQSLFKKIRSNLNEDFWVMEEKLDGCVQEGTLILSNCGDVPIEKVKVGDNVFSFSLENEKIEVDNVIGVYVRDEVEDWIEITTEDGKVLTVTPNHLVWLPELNCYRRADQIEEGDILLIN
jgi:tRNA-binding EMAP/Myf-like protein